MVPPSFSLYKRRHKNYCDVKIFVAIWIFAPYESLSIQSPLPEPAKREFCALVRNFLLWNLKHPQLWFECNCNSFLIFFNLFLLKLVKLVYSLLSPSKLIGHTLLCSFSSWSVSDFYCNYSKFCEKISAIYSRGELIVAINDNIQMLKCVYVHMFLCWSFWKDSGETKNLNKLISCAISQQVLSVWLLNYIQKPVLIKQNVQKKVLCVWKL